MTAQPLRGAMVRVDSASPTLATIDDLRRALLLLPGNLPLRTAHDEPVRLALLRDDDVGEYWVSIEPGWQRQPQSQEGKNEI